jgi:SAM-dependent methyltransferase
MYIRKAVNTFFPKTLFRLSLRKTKARYYWQNQDSGDPHGYEKYLIHFPRIDVLLSEVRQRAVKEATILDLGCNCGYQLSLLKKNGFSALSGVDICSTAIEYGKKNLDLTGIELITGSFEEVLPRLESENRRFDLIYSMGATLELVHPSFDIIRVLCSLSNDYVILGIAEWGHAYPRFWEYEFNTHGFAMVKCIRPIDGTKRLTNPENEESLLVFQKIR